MSSLTPAFAVSTTSLIDAVFDSLRQRIATGEIAAGERVTEGRVVSEYNVARPTAKACIERLVGIGLLQRSTHKSAVVTVLTVEDIDDLFRTRITIESSAARLLAATGDVPRAMLEAQRALDIAGNFEDWTALVRADIDFHSSMVRASGSKRLARMHELITGEILLTIGNSGHHRASITDVAAEHASILDALSAGDPDTAATRLQGHLEAAHGRVRTQYEISEQPPAP